MTGSAQEITRWTERLGSVVAGTVTVLAETRSTQDAARAADARPGDVVVALRQTAGRGRLGRLVVEAGRPERLAIAVAVGVAEAADATLGRAGHQEAAAGVGIKWPNDVVVGGRKLAGVLIEQAGDRALIGIGLNVAQTTWPEPLATRAVSLRQLGAAADRLDVAVDLLRAVPVALAREEGALSEAFLRRDVLIGRSMAFRCGERTVTGRVVGIEPLSGLQVETEVGLEWLPALTTRILG